ncbi:MAG: hypothetical protein ACD_73C00540G0003 [uncultured bacterium]|nr:MAG: hypothetical protein ACD_73C00540G0003 [uncultured bacterium]
MEKSDIKLLIVAAEFKELQVKRFQELAARFEPFDSITSQFFYKKSLWDNKLKKKLTSFSDEQAIHQEIKLGSHTYRWHFENRFYDEDHFYVVNSKMAQMILSKTVTAEKVRLAFYQQAIMEAKDAKLKALFEICHELTFELCVQIKDMINGFHSVVRKRGFFYIIKNELEKKLAFLQEMLLQEIQ